MFRNCEGQSHKTVSLISLTVSVDGKHHVLLTNTGHASVDVTEAAKTHRPVSPEAEPVRPAVAAFDTTDGLSRDHEYSILRSGGASVTDQDTDTAAPFFFKLNVVLRPQKP